MTTNAAMVHKLRVCRLTAGRLYISPYITESTRFITSGANSDIAGG
jgi:hypothetical protein